MALIQVTNVSPLAGAHQMSELFSYFGDIEEIKLFPEDDVVVPSKVCFIQFKNEESASTCLHLSNTVLIDRALIIGKSNHAEMPDSTTALSLAAPAVALANSATKSVGLTAPLLPTPPTLNNTAPAPAANPAVPTTPLISLMGTVVPQPPPLTGNVDPSKIEEIRRTIYVGNLASNMTAEQVLTFFQPCGEIRYVRMAGDETQPTRFAFVEFAQPESVPISLQYNGAMFGERPIKVNHSKNAIVKPQGPTPQEEKRDTDEAMKRVKEAMMAIQASVEPSSGKRRRSRSRSRDRRRRSRSPRRRRSRSRSPFRRRRSRSRSPRRRRSRSRDRPRRRSRSRSPPRRKSRSRSPPRRKSRSRSPPRKRSRSPRHPRRSRSRSPRRRPRKSRSRSPRRRKRESSVEKSPSRSPSPHKRSSKNKRHRSSRSPSPGASPGSRPSSRHKKHSKKHKHHQKSPGPENGRDNSEIGSASEKETKIVKLEPDSDSSY